jgi:hypothetical protein
MDDGAALALFDRWWEILVHRVFDDELGQDFFDEFGGRIPLHDYSPAGGSSFFFDVSGYMDNLFRGLGGYVRDYCDHMGTAKGERCPAVVRASLVRAVKELTEEQGADMGAWTAPAENLQFQNLGAGSVTPIPWQNRGTHNHVVEILSRAP